MRARTAPRARRGSSSLRDPPRVAPGGDSIGQAARLRTTPAPVDPPPVVHRGAPRHADLGRAVCFAGIGSGEVGVGDRKVVGLSQRRTRDWARFQCLVHGRFDAEDSMSVLAPHLTTGVFGDRLRARLANGVGVVALDGLVDDLVARLATR